MSCPDWTRLAAHRRDGDAVASEAAETAWRGAVAHLEVCPECAPRALAADPTLVFHRLPAPEVTADDVEAMRRAVTALRRARRVGEPVAAEAAAGAASLSALRPQLRWLGRIGWRQLAAAAVLAAGSFGLWLSAPDDPAERAAAVSGAAAGEGSVSRPARPGSAATDPVFVDLSEPRSADVYQVGGGDDLTVVMVMDETLDI